MDKTVLIVEDDHKLRRSLCFEFEMNQWKIHEASNVNEALEKLKDIKIDLVVSDIRMPGQSGFYLLQKSKENNPKLPVILITGFSDLGWEEIFDAGAEAFFSKPFKVSFLIEKAEHLLLSMKDRLSENLKKPLRDLGKFSISQTFQSLSSAGEAGSLRLGRGGFFYNLSKDFPMDGEMLKFCFDFTEGPVQKMEGFGIVRWTRCVPSIDASSAGIGVEFFQLSDLESPFVKEIESFNVPAFIPRC